VNTKSENYDNKHVGALITMQWQLIYAWNQSELIIYEDTHNENVTW